MKSEAKPEIIAAGRKAGPAVHILPWLAWDKVLAQTRGLVPETFNSQRRILNLIGLLWS
jgi:hypothetical protein